MRASFLPGPDATVAERIDELKLHEIPLGDGAVLETGCVYIVPLLESLALPADIVGAANPKSSTGRLDVFTRVITDATPRLRPHRRRLSWSALCRDQPADLSDAGARGLTAVADPVPPRPRGARRTPRCTRCTSASGWSTRRAPNISDGVPVGVDLAGFGADRFIGYRAKRHTGLDRCRQPRRATTSPISGSRSRARRDESLILDPDEFYILASREAVQVPPDYAAEMVPFDPLVGEFRVHYAGFFDPGFGHAGAGGRGSRAVLEVRSREVPFILEHGQIVGRLVYEKMLARPDTLYGEGLGSNYQAQSLKLSKHFRVPV